MYLSPDHLQRGVDFINALAAAVKSETGSNYSLLQTINATISGAVGSLANVSRSMDEIAKMVSKVGENLLESTAMVMVQRENLELTAHCSKLERRQQMLINLIRDLSAPCLGCKKAKWEPHQPSCEWASDIERALSKFEEDLSVRLGSVQNVDKG